MKEYKILEIRREKNLQNAEDLMNRMAVEGWEVVSVVPDAHSSIHVKLIITFVRER